jgi:hypothetical protein
MAVVYRVNSESSLLEFRSVTRSLDFESGNVTCQVCITKASYPKD